MAPRYDGRGEGALRRHRRLFPDRFHRRPEKIAVQVLVMHSKDDQIVPYEVAGPLSAKLLQNATFKSYEDLPHEPRPSGCAAGGRHVPWSAISRQTALASVQNVSSTTASVAAAG
jgi:alpha-beta hydrolase superfamily lysophospholipase